MSTLPKPPQTAHTRVQIALTVNEKTEAEFLTQEYYGLSLSQFLKLVTKLLIHERFDISLDLKTTGIQINRPKNPTED